MEDAAPPPHPPHPRLHLSVAVTGHRDLSNVDVERLTAEIRSVFAGLARSLDVGAREMHVLCQLAEGADQLFAEEALAAGARLEAVLPFEPDTYAASLPAAARPNLERLIAQAGAVWTAPLGVSPAERAYHLAGLVMLAQCDLLIAFWDGRPGRGPGGTAAVVAQAVREGVPVVHLDVRGGPARVIWNGFGPVGPARLDPEDAPSRTLDEALLDSLVAAVVSSPADPDQHRHLELFLAERQRRVRWRLEYPLLLALAGVRAMRRGSLLAEPYARSSETEWSTFHNELAGLEIETRDRFAHVQQAFCWSDRLADHYAQVHRGGVIVNYISSAVAVLATLTGMAFPQAKPSLLFVELVSLGALVANTYIGNREQWHRRWLDYRYLAEQLRPLRSLKLVGAFGPKPRSGPQGDPVAETWTDWYAAAVWRTLALPPRLANGDRIAQVASCLVEQELKPQISYHEQNARRMHALDHRLHRAGTALFIASLALSGFGLFGYFIGTSWVAGRGEALASLGIALPTLGGALFGIRGQNDFAGVARRSAETAQRLRRTAARLSMKPSSLSDCARLMEDAAQVMAADLGEWRATFVDRRLSIPA